MVGGRTQEQLMRSPAVALSALLGGDDASAAASARALVRDAVGIEAETLTLETVAYSSGSPTTGGLYRLRATGQGGSASLFCKVVQHVRHWPGLVMLPEQFREAFAAELPWRTELELWDPIIQRSLPTGLRTPVLHRLVELGDDRIAAWQEDIAIGDQEWSTAAFAEAAELLGRWNARCADPAVLATSPYPAGHGLRMYATRSVLFRGVGPLADDALWAHPWLREHGDLRTRLLALAPEIPAMLDRLDALPQTLPHGDASPQNLLRTETGIVVIDLSFRTPHALGFDLGQLLVGLVHAGEMPASRMPEVAAAILPAYADGVRAEGVTVTDAELAEGFALSALLRSGFDGFLYEAIGDEPQRHAFDERIAMSRFLLQQHAVLGTR